MYRGRDRINLTEKLDLCDDGNILSNKDKFFEIGKLRGLNPKLEMRYPIKVGIWQIVKWKVEHLCDSRRSSKSF